MRIVFKKQTEMIPVTERTSKRHILPCGHHVYHRLHVSYRCCLPGCIDRHGTVICEICEREGNAQMPDDFGAEIQRRRIYRKNGSVA